MQRCVVVLDTFAQGYDDDGFERAVVAAASVVAAATAVGITTRLVAPGIDLRGPDVAPQSLRWLATVTTGGEVVDHTAAGRTNSDGLGLLVVVTSHATSAAAAAAIGSAGPDESLVVVSSMAAAAGGKGFHVDATSHQHLHRSWNQLVLGRSGAFS